MPVFSMNSLSVQCHLYIYFTYLHQVKFLKGLHDRARVMTNFATLLLIISWPPSCPWLRRKRGRRRSRNTQSHQSCYCEKQQASWMKKYH